jgi:hypothetical protein
VTATEVWQDSEIAHPGAPSTDGKWFCRDFTFPVTAAGSNGRRNTIWYKSVFKGGVYEARETVWAFHGAEDRCVASWEGGSDVA